MANIVVTGARGQLGKPTVAALRDDGHHVIPLSHSTTDDYVHADLFTGAGLAEALAGADTVVHLASSSGKRDARMTVNLLTAARTAAIGHVIMISIVGIDKIPMSFYRTRLLMEQLAQVSGLPITIQRATQFHSLIDTLFRGQRRLPVAFAPTWRLQPIAVADVARRLAELAQQPPPRSGLRRAPDIGGPQTQTLDDLYSSWREATGVRQRLINVTAPGTLFSAFNAGAALVSGTPYGTGRFEEYLRATYH